MAAGAGAGGGFGVWSGDEPAGVLRGGGGGDKGGEFDAVTLRCV